MSNPFDYDRPTRTHRVVVTFEMEEMNGTPEESAAVLLDLYVADEATVVSVEATEVKATDLIDALRLDREASEALWCEGGWAV